MVKPTLIGICEHSASPLNRATAGAQMRAAGLVLACLVIGGGIAAGYVAADPEVLADVGAFGLPQFTQKNEAKVYPQSNRDNKLDRMIALRTDRADVES